MEKEYKTKFDEIEALLLSGERDEALEELDSINWRKIHNQNAFMRAAEIYEKAGRMDDAKELLSLSHERSPMGRKALKQLALLCVRMGDFEEAKACYDEFVEIAPHDSSKYVIKYELNRAKGADAYTLISILEELKETDFDDHWAYELATLYRETNQPEKCIELCDEISTYFGEGPYVERALELKMLFHPLNKDQEEKYRSFRLKRDGLTEIKANEVLDSGEIVNRDITIPEIELSPDRFNTVNLQAEIKKNIEEIMQATAAAEVTENMEAIKDLVNEIPMVQKEETAANAESDVEKHKEAKNKLDDTLRNTFREFLQEEYDGQISLYVPERKGPEPQVKGQMTIEEVLEDWEKTKRAAEATLRAVEAEQLKTAKEEALREAAEIMERLEDIAPQLDAGIAPAEIMKQEILSDISDLPASAAVTEAAVSEETLPAIEVDEALFAGAVSEPPVQSAIEKYAAVHAEVETAEVPEIEETAEAPEPEAAAEEIPQEEEVPLTEEASEDEAATEEEILPEEISAEEEILSEEEEIPTEEEIPSEEEILPAEEITEEVSSEEISAEEEASPEEEALPESETEIGPENNIEETPEEPERKTFPIPRVDAEGTLTGIGLELPTVDPEETAVLPVDPADIEPKKKKRLSQNTKEWAPPRLEGFIETIEPDFFGEEEETMEPDFFEEKEEAPVDEGPQKSIEEIKEESERAEAERKEDKLQEELELIEQKWSLDPNQPIELDEKEKELFSYFIPIEGMERTICKVLSGTKKRLVSKDSPASSGNIIIQGGRGSGKSTMAESLIKVLRTETGRPGKNIGTIRGDNLNEKDIQSVFSKVCGGGLIIENAGDISHDTAVTVSLLLENDRDGTLLILEDTRVGIERLKNNEPTFMRMFTEKISIPIFSSDELVTFAKKYAKDEGYVLDEMAELALYERIGRIQRLDRPTYLTEVKEIIDGAIEKADTAGLRGFFGRFAARKEDEDGNTILAERDFEE